MGPNATIPHITAPKDSQAIGTFITIFGTIIVILILMKAFDSYVKYRHDTRSITLHDPEIAGGPYGVEALDRVAPALLNSNQAIEISATELPGRSGNYLICIICLEILDDQEIVRRLPCCHIFHSTCITKWFLKQHDTCPICNDSYILHRMDCPGPVPAAETLIGI